MGESQSLPDSADTVVVGAGIVGCAVAHHLSERRDDVVVLEQGPIFETGGSTSHAPAMTIETVSSKSFSRIGQYTVDLYSDLSVDGTPALEQVGNVEFALSEEVMDAMRRKQEHGLAWGVSEAQLLSAEEVHDVAPLLDGADSLQGAFYASTDGYTNPVVAAEAMGRRAQDNGVRFVPHTTVTDVETEDGVVTAVETDRGTVETDTVLAATNLWAPLLEEMVDVEIPYLPVVHQYAVTEDVPTMEGLDSHPILRNKDIRLYFREEGPTNDAVGIGSYRHDARIVDPHDLPHPDEDDSPAKQPYTPADFDPIYEEVQNQMPALDGCDVADGFDGLLGYTPDGLPLLGPAPDVDGLWLALHVYITHAGGVGKLMAEWMTEGTPALDDGPVDVTNLRVDRFEPHVTTSEYLRTRAHEDFGEHYDVIHPKEPDEKPRGLRRSPFYAAQDDLGGAFFDVDGWERPRWYDANERLLDEYDVPERTGWEAEYWSPVEGAEHLAVRDGVGLCDLSLFNTIEVTGPDALATVQHLFSRDLDVDPGEVRYALLLNRDGGIEGDATVARMGPDRFVVTASGGRAGRLQHQWMEDNAPESADVAITNRVSGTTAIGLWGPDARAVLESVTTADVSDGGFPYYTAREIDVGSVPVRAQRLSYVGEPGWELHAPMEYGGRLWEVLRDAGSEYDAVPMGDGALGSMRLEKGYVAWGTDVDPVTTPAQAGLEFAVDDGDFLGSDAVAAGGAPDERLRTLELREPGAVVMPRKPVFDGDDVVGYVTSAEYGYSVDAGLAFAYLPSDVDAGSTVDVKYEDDRYAATVTDGPVFDPDDSKLESS